MNRMGTALLSAASLLAAGTAAATVREGPVGSPQWTYFQVGYYETDGFENFGRADGGDIRGSLGFLENWHIGVSYVDADFDVFDVSGDYDGYRIWGGWHQAVSSSGNTHAFADVFYYDLDGGEGGGSTFKFENKGYGVAFGVRSVLLRRLELEGAVQYARGTAKEKQSGTTVFDEDYTGLSYVIGGRYHWSEIFSTGVTITLDDAASNSGGLYGSSSNSIIFDVRASWKDFF